MHRGARRPHRRNSLPSRPGPSPSARTVRLTLAEASRRYLRDQGINDHSPATIRWYEQKLGQLRGRLGDVALEAIEKEQLLDLVAELRSLGRSRAYVRNWFGFFRAFFGWAREEGYELHPSLVREGEQWFALRKPPAVLEEFTAYSRDDVERMIEAAGETGEPYTSARNRLFIRLLAGTGLRLNEALALQLDDCQDDRLRVRSGKGRRTRYVPMSARLQRDLIRYLERVRPDSDTIHETRFVFLNRSGEPWHQAAVYTLFERLKRELGFRAHPHGLRHFFATEYLRRGGEIERLRRILGHTSYAMVSRYLHLSGPDLGRGIDDLSPF